MFQRYALMNHGSVLGNGAYFGNGLTADTLAQKTQFMPVVRPRALRESYDSLDDLQ